MILDTNYINIFIKCGTKEVFFDIDASKMCRLLYRLYVMDDVVIVNTSTYDI